MWTLANGHDYLGLSGACGQQGWPQHHAGHGTSLASLSLHVAGMKHWVSMLALLLPSPVEMLLFQAAGKTPHC